MAHGVYLEVGVVRHGLMWVKNMDAVHITQSSIVRDGLDRMLTAAIGPHEYLTSDYVEAPIVLLIIEIARRAEDKPKWFPRGKWATIQSMQAACDQELGKIFSLE